MIDDFEELHKKSIESLKFYYENEYSSLKEEDIRKNFMAIIKSKNFIENHILKISYDFQDSEYNSFL